MEELPKCCLISFHYIINMSLNVVILFSYRAQSRKAYLSLKRSLYLSALFRNKYICPLYSETNIFVSFIQKQIYAKFYFCRTLRFFTSQKYFATWCCKSLLFKPLTICFIENLRFETNTQHCRHLMLMQYKVVFA